MGTIDSQPASKSSWDSQDFGDISMLLKWPIFASPPGHDELMACKNKIMYGLLQYQYFGHSLKSSVNNFHSWLSWKIFDRLP